MQWIGPCPSYVEQAELERLRAQYAAEQARQRAEIARLEAEARATMARQAKTRTPNADPVKVACAPLPRRGPLSITTGGLSEARAISGLPVFKASRSPKSARSSSTAASPISATSTASSPTSATSPAPTTASPTSPTKPKRNPFAHPFTAAPVLERRPFASEGRKAADAQFRKATTGAGFGRGGFGPFLSGATGGDGEIGE